MAGPPIGVAQRPVPAHVGHPRPDGPLRRGPDPAHRPPRSDRGRHGPTGAAHLRIPRDSAPRIDHRTGRRRPCARLHRPLHPEGRLREGPGSLQPRRAHQGRKGCCALRGGRVPVRHANRQGPEAVHRSRHRPAPCWDAPPVPPTSREAGPGRTAEAHLRHRHPWGGRQCADPHRAVYTALQVRRRLDPPARQPGVRPDQRPGRATGLRRRGPCMGAGAGPLDREPPGRGQGGGRPRQEEEVGEEEATRSWLRPLERGVVPEDCRRDP